jgi:hypothetical protein
MRSMEYSLCQLRKIVQAPAKEYATLVLSGCVVAINKN